MRHKHVFTQNYNFSKPLPFNAWNEVDFVKMYIPYLMWEKVESFGHNLVKKSRDSVSNHLTQYIGWNDVTYLWPQYDRHFAGQDSRTVRS